MPTSPRSGGVRRAVILSLAALAAATPAAVSDSSQYYQTTALPSARHMHGASALGNYLYIFGGNDAREGFTNSALRAPISADGEVGPWAPATPMNDPLAYIGNATVTHQRFIYICGGNIHTNDNRRNESSTVVTMAAQFDDGSLSRWITSAPFPNGVGVQAAAAVATDSHLYVIGGGSTANRPQDVVFYAPFAGGGLLGPWQSGPPLPRAVWFHMAGIANGRIYVWGGTTGANYEGAIADCVSAGIQPDGSLDGWRQESPMASPIYFSAAASIDGALYNFSGRFRDQQYTSDVLFTIPTRTGPLEWHRVRANVPLNRYLAPAVDHRRGIVFFPGGRSAEGPIADVFGYRVARVVEVAADFGPGTATSSTPATTATSPVQAPSPPARTVALGSEWLTVSDAEAQARSARRNMLLYFYTPQASRCERFENDVLESDGFAPVASSHVLAQINAADDQETAIAYGVFRVPTVVITSPDGQPLATFSRDISLGDLTSAP